MADIVDRYIVENAASAGADAARASLEKLSDAAEKLIETSERVGKSSTALTKRYDEQSKLAASLATLQRDLAAAQRAYDDALAKGEPNAAALGRSMDTIRERIRSQQAAMLQLGSTTDSGVAANARYAASHDQVNMAMRQTGVQVSQFFTSVAAGQPILTASMWQFSNLNDVLMSQGVSWKQLGGSVVSAIASINPFVLAAGAAALAIGGLTYASESAARRVDELQNTLRATHDGFAGMATAAEEAARSVASSSNVSLSAARAAATTIASMHDFSGNSADLATYIKLANDLAATMGKTVPEAAGVLASAYDNVGSAAKKMADSGSYGFTVQLAEQIKLMEAGGNKAGAYGAFLDQLRAKTFTAADNTTVLSKAITGLENAFTSSADSGDGFFRRMGDGLTTIAAKAVEAITAIVSALDAGSKKLASLLDEGAKQVGKLIPQVVTGGRLPGVDTHSQDVLEQIAAGASFGATPETSGARADLAQRIMAAESNGRQFDPSGRGGLYTSSAGAQGAFQLMPKTAAGLQVNPATLEGNITGGWKYINQLADYYHDDPELVAMAYNWGPDNLNKFLAGVKNFGVAPTETQNYVQTVLGHPMTKVAGSGGGAVPGVRFPGYGGGGTSVASGGVGGGELYGPTYIGGSGAPGFASDPTQAALASYSASNALSLRIAQNQALQKSLQSGIDAAKSKDDTDTVNKLSEALSTAQVAAKNLITEQDKLARSAQEAVAPLMAQEGAARALASIDVQFAAAARSAGEQVNGLAVAAAKAAKLQELSTTFDDMVAKTNRAAEAEEKLVPALEKTGKAAEYAANAAKAAEDVRATSLPGTAERARQLDAETQALNRLTDAENAKKAAGDIAAFGQQNEMLQTQIGLIAETVDVRNTELAVMRERQKLGLALSDQASDEEQKALDAARANAELQNSFMHMQESMARQRSVVDDFAGMVTQAFDQVGQAITQAFISGQGAAVNWGNVARGVLASVLQEALKLAVLNPILNGMFGGGRTTIADVGGVLGMGGDTSAGGMLSDVLGLGKSAFQGIKDVLATPLWGGTTAAGVGSEGALMSGGANGMISEGAISNIGVSATPAVTVGSLLGGGLAGFGLGSMLSGMISPKEHQTQGMVGSGIGALAGAVLGPLTGGISALLGGLLGGAGGGLLGGLFGPGKPHPAVASDVSAVDGKLVISNTGSAKMTADEVAKSVAAVQSQVDTVNTFLASVGVKAVQGGRTLIGTGMDNASANLESTFKSLRFEGSGTIGQVINGKEFGSSADLQEAIKAAQTYDAALATTAGTVGTFNEQMTIINTLFGAAQEAAQKYGLATETLTAAQQKAINILYGETQNALSAIEQPLRGQIAGRSGDPYTAAVMPLDVQFQAQFDQTSKALIGIMGEQYRGTANFNQIMTELSQAYLLNRAAVLQDTIDRETSQQNAITTGLQLRYLTATGQTQLASNLQRNTQFFSDVSAINTQAKESQGPNWETSQWRLDNLAQLRATFDAETRALANNTTAINDNSKAVRDAAASKAGDAISALTDYASSLTVGDKSPLSPYGKLAASAAEVSRIGIAAQRGDVASVSQFPGAANTYLEQARNVFGTGLQYVEAFKWIKDQLAAISNVSPNTLIANVISKESQTQTATLVAKLNDLQKEVAKLGQDMRLAVSAPARAA